MISVDAVHSVLRTVLDPEMPINIVDLGIVADVRLAGGVVEVDVTPTFVGCPALDVLRDDIVAKLRTAGTGEARVRFIHDPPWSVERISDAGREAHAGAWRDRSGTGWDSHDWRHKIRAADRFRYGARVACPYCGSERTHQESRFGPTHCRMIYYCDACRNQFEHMKTI